MPIKHCKSCTCQGTFKRGPRNLHKQIPCAHCGKLFSKFTKKPLCRSMECRLKGNMIIDGNGCWVWNGKLNSIDKYASIMVDGKHKQTHRVSYEFFKGPIPPGKLICHSCDNPPCINPDHLWIGTTEANIADKVRKGRS